MFQLQRLAGLKIQPQVDVVPIYSKNLQDEVDERWCSCGVHVINVSSIYSMMVGTSPKKPTFRRDRDLATFFHPNESSMNNAHGREQHGRGQTDPQIHRIEGFLRVVNL